MGWELRPKYSTATDLHVLQNALEKTDSVCRANYGIDLPATLTGRILRVHYGSNYFDQLGDEETARSLHDRLLPATAEGYLRKTLDDTFAAAFHPQPYNPQPLPDGPGTDIIRRLVAPHQGRYVLIDFWGTGCGPCRYGIEQSTEVRRKFKYSPDLVFVYVTDTSNSPSEKIYAAYVAAHMLSYPSHRLPQGEYNYLCELFRFTGIPHYVVLDRQGRLIDGNYSFLCGERLENSLQMWMEMESPNQD